MHAKTSPIVVVVAIVLLAIVSVRAWWERQPPTTFRNGDPRDALPKDWNADAFLVGIEKVMRREAHSAKLAREDRETSKIEVDLLAWSRQEGRDPQRDLYENALGYVHVETTGKNRWVLVWMTRFPLRDPAWRPVYVTDTEWRPFRSFDHPPRNAEIDDFLSGLKPSGDFFRPLDWSFRFLSSAVREHTWRMVVGEPPTESFPDNGEADPSR
jgi:hypothetical protein